MMLAVGIQDHAKTAYEYQGAEHPPSTVVVGSKYTLDIPTRHSSSG